ncbi:hypothetical protein BH10PSE11_BH10PSE11_27160 [soil metagenome]
MQIAILTNGHPHGWRILGELLDRGIKVDVFCYEARLSWAECRWTRLHSKTTKNTISGAISRWLFRRWKWVGVRLRTLLCGVRLETVENVNVSASMKNLDVDLIVLGGIGIVGEATLSKARVGVLNGHPGLLPWLRGTGVVGAAIDQGIPVGATCHLVDLGVDTGAIISRQVVCVDSSFNSLSALEEAAEKLASRLVVDVVAHWVVSGKRPVSFVHQEHFARCRWPNSEGRLRQETAVKQGRATQLFERCLADGACDSNGVLSLEYSRASNDY